MVGATSHNSVSAMFYYICHIFPFIFFVSFDGVCYIGFVSGMCELLNCFLCVCLFLSSFNVSVLNVSLLQ